MTLKQLENLYQVLNAVIPGKVFYGTNHVDETDTNVLPYIIYQEMSDRAVLFADNVFKLRQITIQITLVSPNKNPALEAMLEEALRDTGRNYQMLTEYLNDDGSVNRIYEIKMEGLN